MRQVTEIASSSRRRRPRPNSSSAATRQFADAQLTASLPRQPGQGRRRCSALGSVLEADGAGVAERVELGQKLVDRLLAGARLVPTGHVGDLDVLDRCAGS